MIRVIVLSLLSAILAGCVVVPAGYASYDDGYYHRHHYYYRSYGYYPGYYSYYRDHGQ